MRQKRVLEKGSKETNVRHKIIHTAVKTTISVSKVIMPLF